jgi:hypothetical protein
VVVEVIAVVELHLQGVELDQGLELLLEDAYKAEFDLVGEDGFGFGLVCWSLCYERA